MDDFGVTNGTLAVIAADDTNSIAFSRSPAQVPAASASGVHRVLLNCAWIKHVPTAHPTMQYGLRCRRQRLLRWLLVECLKDCHTLVTQFELPLTWKPSHAMLLA